MGCFTRNLSKLSQTFSPWFSLETDFCFGKLTLGLFKLELFENVGNSKVYNTVSTQKFGDFLRLLFAASEMEHGY